MNALDILRRDLELILILRDQPDENYESSKAVSAAAELIEAVDVAYRTRDFGGQNLMRISRALTGVKGGAE